MAHVVVLGAGLGGTIAAYELRDKLGADHSISVVTNGSHFHFVPSNPWVGVGWRDRAAIEVDLSAVFAKRRIALHSQGAKRLHPADRRIELNDGGTLGYDYLVIATGPDLAFDEIEGFGPEAHTHSICHVDHALQAKRAVDALIANPGPVVIGAVQGASCFGPAYEFAFILDKALRDARVRDQVPQTFTMMLPAFRGIEAVRGIEGLTNPRGFVLADTYQRNPAFPEVFSVGVCVAIPPVGKTPVPVGVPKTGFMIESMVTAAVHNIDRLIGGLAPDAVATWNAVCLADFGDGGIAFVAQPQIPPRNVNWSSSGRWVHLAKIAFEKYFIHKIRSGKSEPFYERLAMQTLGIEKLKEVQLDRKG